MYYIYKLSKVNNDDYVVGLIQPNLTQEEINPYILEERSQKEMVKDEIEINGAIIDDISPAITRAGLNHYMHYRPSTNEIFYEYVEFEPDVEDIPQTPRTVEELEQENEALRNLLKLRGVSL